ncbi:PREDICTED: serine/threonine-protein phosphatase 4 regulatory subunit 2 isoform X2 [Tarenaya hassleriana]|uniref:serine/threonine-protein phosphatase 4 regulatory subunit 2 isoform X2 n=1 Tax=Tarenaya hassleriana TaxID=28532 RepID=UPI00053C7533|nr:PREDICTED: serine/threonine-protein phosphatase 4 regulatory subunit 2 isoform X2 [Tarenaya hassleriana]
MEKPSDATSNSSPSLPPKDDGEQPPVDTAVVPDVVDHDGAEPKPEMSEEEIKGTLEAIASTGKFCQDWDKLKGMLSFWLKQVLSEYPEAKMTTEQQNACLGETYSELVSRLDEALLCFDEGPPFTLQRLCEILLAARCIYPKLSKLALALEKNLLVTSMLAVSVDTTTGQNTEEARQETKSGANWAPNGVESMGGEKDEIMTEVEEADIDDAMTIDAEATDEMVEPSETNQPPSENS